MSKLLIWTMKTLGMSKQITHLDKAVFYQDEKDRAYRACKTLDSFNNRKYANVRLRC